MRDSVKISLLPWLGQFEGLWVDSTHVFAWLGLDVRGRPAGPIGSDFPTPQSMAKVAWRHNYEPMLGGVGTRAAYDEICHEWARVAAMTSHAGAGGASSVFRDSAKLYVDLASLFRSEERRVGKECRSRW